MKNSLFTLAGLFIVLHVQIPTAAAECRSDLLLGQPALGAQYEYQVLAAYDTTAWNLTTKLSNEGFAIHSVFEPGHHHVYGGPGVYAAVIGAKMKGSREKYLNLPRTIAIEEYRSQEDFAGTVAGITRDGFVIAGSIQYNRVDYSPRTDLFISKSLAAAPKTYEPRIDLGLSLVHELSFYRSTETTDRYTVTYRDPSCTEPLPSAYEQKTLTWVASRYGVSKPTYEGDKRTYEETQKEVKQELGEQHASIDLESLLNQAGKEGYLIDSISIRPRKLFPESSNLYIHDFIMKRRVRAP